MDPVAEIKERISIVDLVERAGLTVTGRGRVRTTKEHDSLKMWPEYNTFHWYSKGIKGDIFDWWEMEHRCDFRRALEDLAHLAGVELRPPTPEQQRVMDDERARARILNLACQSYHDVLMNHPAARAAREYCHERGWTDETLRSHRIGYALRWNDSVRDEAPPLSAQLHDAKLLEHPMAKAVLSIPMDTLVYPHLIGGQCVYLSGRGVSQKRHYNLPADLAGPKRLYRADPADDHGARQEAVKKSAGITVLVEGQADALSLAQWGFQAVALCGVEPGQGLHPTDMRALQGISHVALDNDPAGQMKALDVTWRIDPLRRVMLWPSVYINDEHGGQVPVKDGNDLLRAGAPAALIERVIDEAVPALLLRARAARRVRGEERSAHIEQIGRAWLALDDLAQADLGVEVARELGVGLSQFKRLMQAVADRAKAEDKEEKNSPENYETSAGGIVGDLVFEQCVRWSEIGEPSSYFAVKRPDGTIEQKPLVDAGGTSYVPYPAKIALIKRKVILFPSEPVDYGSQKALLHDVRAFIHKWLDVDPFYEQLAAYYVMFTWLFDMFETLPYLRALGDYGTGKTRFIQTIGAVCYRPMFVSGASTASPIFRVMDMFKGTLVVDEADFAKSDAAVEIIKIVNVGYSRGGVVLRSEKDEESDSYYPSAKDVFGPKILATRKLFEDRATESRCLTKRMTTARPRPGIPRMLNRAFWDEAQALRNKLLMYRLRNWRITEVREDLSDASIEPRLDQVTLALKTLIDDQEMRDQINHFVRAYNATLITDRQMSVPAVVVQVLANTWWLPEQTLTGPRRDFTIKGVSERVQEMLNELDPDERVSPRRLGSLLSADLGLTKRAKDPESRRDTVVVEEGELLALMGRYGIDIPEQPQQP